MPAADIDKANPSDMSLSNSKILEETNYIPCKNFLEEAFKETISQISNGLGKVKENSNDNNSALYQ